MNLNKLFLRWIAVFGMVMLFAASGWGDGGSNDSCNGEQISELHGIASTTSRTETGTVSSSDSNDYYYFTPGVAGTLTYSYSATESTDFYLSKTGCGDDRKVNNGTSYSSSTLSVSASDTVYIRVKRESGSPSYSIPLTFTVTTTIAPIINDQSFSIAENSAVGTTVGTVSATNSPTAFSITGGSGSSLFNISNTGVITVATGAVLDYETATSYTLNITASNAAGSDTAVITINLTNVTGPVITSGQNLNIATGSANGTTVGTVVTTGTAPTAFTISGTVFAINNSGVISVANSGALGAIGTVHTLTVGASNSEGTDSKTVTVTVTDASTGDSCSVSSSFSQNPLVAGSPYTKSDSVDGSSTDNYYFKAPAAGTVQVVLSGSAADAGEVVFSTSLATCPSASGGLTSTTLTIAATDLDFNLKVYRPSGTKNRNYTITVTYTAPSNADLSITKTVNNVNPSVGDTITFTLRGMNNGSGSSQMTITDTLPVNLTLVSRSENSSDFSCSNIANAVTCTGARVFANGDTVDVTITATVNSAGAATNTASITSANGVTDNVPSNNSASASFSTSLLAPTVVAGQAFNIPTFSDNGMTVGTVATTGGVPTAFSIMSGNSAGHFSISNTGVITLIDNTALGATGTVYTLEVNASNATGSDTKNVVVNITDATVIAANYRDFTLRKQLYTKGNMKTIGNTVLVAPTGTPNCSTYTNGTYLTASTAANGDTTLCGYSVDGTQQNATTSELALPTGSKVLWAGLYWQGMMKTAIDTSMFVKIRKDNGAYIDVHPNILNYADSGFNYDGADGISYSAVSDITYLFGTDKWNEGNYTVAGVPVIEGGKGSGLGTYGAWTLVVIYENSTEAFRSFSVFDGWKQVTSSTDAVIPVSGFYTPNRVLDAADAKVSVFAAEGDLPYTGDQLVTKNYNTNTNVALETITNNTFNSSVTGGGLRTPNPSNNFGIDIQSFDIGNLLKPKQTDMTFTFTSNLDVYWPSMIAFSTELVAPQLCYDYSFKQDGHYLETDNDGSQLPLITGIISDSTIDTSIYVRSNEADILAQGLSFYSDVNDTMFQFIDNTVATSNVNGSSLIPRTNTTGGCSYTDTATTPIGCTNGSDIRIGVGKNATGYSKYGGGSLGDKEFVYAKFSMDPIGVAGLADVNQSLGFRLNYYIIPKTGADPIPYNYEFGTDIPLCPPTSGYEPIWGTFNVVESGATLLGNGLPVNNIRTQVSRNPFNVSVAAYGKDTSGAYTIKPTADINTTLLVEIINSGPYHDANATCGNPDAAVSQSIFVPITVSNSAPTDPIPVQSALFHNFAVKNGAFRIWYFDDGNQTLIQNWTATTSDATRLNLTGISNLYKSTVHTECATECGVSTSTACFECIKANYAKPLCSRDNFSVRPESYDVRVYDINQTLAKGDAIKDTTKNALSVQYQYAPMYATATGRMNLAAGYDYRFDMNATGHDTNLSGVPGYTRFFNGENVDYNATMIWEPTTTKSGCNDTNGKSLSFYVANGEMVNSEQNQTQVGEYRLNVIDPGWTEVDWKTSLTGHHLLTNGFESEPTDCIVDSTSTIPSNGKIGCVTSSAHNGGGYTYKDHLLELKPYQFTMPSSFQFGTVPYTLNTAWSYDGNLTNDVLAQTNTLYYSNISKNADMNMSVQINGTIGAVGYNGGTLTNFVRDCYSKPINLMLDHNRSSTQTRATYQSRFLDYNSTGTLIYDSGAVNVPNIGAAMIQTVNDGNFTKDMNGALDSRLRLNFDRNASVVLNPMTVKFYDYNLTCPDCNRSADLTIDVAKGSVEMGFDAMHYYGRAQGRDATYFTGATTAGGYARIYFEVYCSDAANAANGGVDCDMGALTSAMAGETPGWYVNIDHNTTNDGRSDSDNTLSTGNLKVGTAVIPPPGSVSITPTEVGFERYGVNYNGGNGYPYTVIMENYSDGWLIYNTVNPNILYNTFELKFRKKGAWIGEGKSGTATDNDAPIQTNRRIMW